MIYYSTNYPISDFQKEVIDRLSYLYPTHSIFVEIPVDEYLKFKNKYDRGDIDSVLRKRVQNLRFDIYNSTLDTVYEIQGQQHHTYIPYFHSTQGDFDQQKRNDFLKKTICDLYNTTLIEINTKEEIENL
jgi:hypothetical protein